MTKAAAAAVVLTLFFWFDLNFVTKVRQQIKVEK
jgi:hypothetical protein